MNRKLDVKLEATSTFQFNIYPENSKLKEGSGIFTKAFKLEPFPNSGIFK